MKNLVTDLKYYHLGSTYNIIKYYYQGAIQGPRRPLLEMCSDPKDVSLYLCEITVESQNFRSEHNFKAHIIFTKEHLGSVIWWLAQSHTAGQREEFSVQVWLPAPKPECPTRYYFCAWLTSSPIRPCKLPHKSSGWNTPCLTIKRPTFVVICLHLQIPVLKIERLIIRDCGLRDRFPWGCTMSGESWSHQTLVCTSPRTPAKSSLKNGSGTFRSWSPILRGWELVQSQYIYVTEVFPLATLGDTEVTISVPETFCGPHIEL